MVSLWVALWDLPWPISLLPLMKSVCSTTTKSQVPIFGMWMTHIPFSKQCDTFLKHLNNLDPALQFTFEKEENDSLPFLDVLVEKSNTGFLTSVYRKPTFTGKYTRWNSFCPKQRKVNLVKTLVQRALMICSKSKLHAELEKLKTIFLDNGYPEDIILSYTKERIASLSAVQKFGPQKCPVYLKLPWNHGLVTLPCDSRVRLDKP